MTPFGCRPAIRTSGAEHFQLATNFGGVHVGCHCWAPLLGCHCWGAIAGVAGCHHRWALAADFGGVHDCRVPCWGAIARKIDQSVTLFCCTFLYIDNIQIGLCYLGSMQVKYFSQGSCLAKQICINMVPMVNFPCWFAKANEKSESIVESCLHLPSCIARCFFLFSPRQEPRAM